MSSPPSAQLRTGAGTHTPQPRVLARWLTASAPTNDGGYGSPRARGRRIVWRVRTQWIATDSICRVQISNTTPRSRGAKRPDSFAGSFRRLLRLSAWKTGSDRRVVKTALLTSRPRDFHPRALPEPYVNLSIHTAPDVRPLPWHSGQWAKSVGFARRSRSNQSLAPLVQWTIRLYLRRAHRMT